METGIRAIVCPDRDLHLGHVSWSVLSQIAFREYRRTTRGTMKQKVFCIGFHKTGTTSLSQALNTLGFRVTGPNGVDDPDIGKNVYEMAYALVERFDAFQDNPWPIIFKEIDTKYPGSKFILLLRDSDSWIRSQVRHFGSKQTPMRRWIYGAGCPKGHEATYVRRFEAHNREVLEYFRNRSDDLLVMNLGEGDGWEKLCPFLGEQLPALPFPHANQAVDRERHALGANKLFRRVRLSVSDWFK